MGYERCSMKKGKVREVFRKVSCYEQIRRVQMFTYEKMHLQ